ncbi:MAG: DUF305 domain-containing protein [bacterium]|nr:DUF305 domain-containing protein [bacterium]
MNKQTILALVIGLVVGGGSIQAINNLNQNDSSNTTQTKTSTADHNAQATSKLENLKGDDFDKAFIEEMLLHHQGAVDMAKLVETNAKHSELKQLGQEIISAQSKEIDMMQAWQSDWGYKDVPASHSDSMPH